MELEMETETGTGPTPPTTGPLSSVYLWYFLGKRNGGAHRVEVPVDLQSLTLAGLKEIASQQLKAFPLNPSEIDLMYNGKKLVSDEVLKSAEIKGSTVITVLKYEEPVKRAPVDVATASKNTMGQVPQIALALRTAFFNPNFIQMIEKLGQSDMLENILAIAHGLQDDPVGIAIIQDPAMIIHLSDVESLKRLANTKPWVVEAFNFLAASVHQEKGSGPSSSRGSSSRLFSASMFEDDDMDDAESGEADGAGPNSLITREQLAAALNSLSAFGRGGLSSAGQSQGGSSQTPAAFLDLLSQASRQAASAPAASSNPARPSGNNSNLTGLSMPSMPFGGSATSPVLNADSMARAFAEVLERLPADRRSEQLNAFRNFASRIQQLSPGSGMPQPTSNASAVPPPTSSVTANPLAVQYRTQLSQMREMGISTNERLCIQALQVTDGDVELAVDLVLNGWTGEGANN